MQQQQPESLGIFSFTGQVFHHSLSLILRIFGSTHKVLDSVDKGLDGIHLYASTFSDEAEKDYLKAQARNAAELAQLRKDLGLPLLKEAA